MSRKGAHQPSTSGVKLCRIHSNPSRVAARCSRLRAALLCIVAIAKDRLKSRLRDSRTAGKRAGVTRHDSGRLAVVERAPCCSCP